MSREALQNLVRIGSLKAEPPSRIEFEGLLRSGQRQNHIEQQPQSDIDHIQRRLTRYCTLEFNRRGVENQSTGTRKRHRAA
jgi:hypothetical protein